jgi:hypothetical protein
MKQQRERLRNKKSGVKDAVREIDWMITPFLEKT